MIIVLIIFPGRIFFFSSFSFLTSRASCFPSCPPVPLLFSSTFISISWCHCQSFHRKFLPSSSSYFYSRTLVLVKAWSSYPWKSSLLFDQFQLIFPVPRYPEILYLFPSPYFSISSHCHRAISRCHKLPIQLTHEINRNPPRFALYAFWLGFSDDHDHYFCGIYHSFCG